jgi:hypothetical protein
MIIFSDQGPFKGSIIPRRKGGKKQDSNDNNVEVLHPFLADIFYNS